MRNEITQQLLERAPWEFSRNFREVYAHSFTFLKDGKVGCYEHFNENSWLLDSGNLIMKDKNGQSTCVYSRSDKPSDADYLLTGVFLGDTNNAMHVLRRRKQTIGCYLRTHYWDDTVSLVFEFLQNAWKSNVAVYYDHTNGFVPPNNTENFGHELDSFQKLGLPLLPARHNALWYNGDYPLYELILKTDYDYLVMVEYDLLVKQDLQGLVDHLIVHGVDFVAPTFGLRPPEWGWHQIQVNWDNFERSLRGETTSKEQDVFGCLFPFTFVSRKAALWLYSRRVQMGQLFERFDGHDWPFCESFVASELVRNDFNVNYLEVYVEDAKITSDDPFSLKKALASSASFVHPVFSGQRLVLKMEDIARNRHRSNGAAISQTLKTFRERVGTREESEFLEAKILEL